MRYIIHLINSKEIYSENIQCNYGKENSLMDMSNIYHPVNIFQANILQWAIHLHLEYIHHLLLHNFLDLYIFYILSNILSSTLNLDLHKNHHHKWINKYHVKVHKYLYIWYNYLVLCMLDILISSRYREFH